MLPYVSFKMKLILYMLNLQVTFSCFFVDGVKIIPLFSKEPGREKRGWMHKYLENVHMPDWYKPHLSRDVNGTTLPHPYTTPDYRLAEPPFMGHPTRQSYNYFEYQRPIRMSPHYKQYSRWKRYRLRWFQPENDEIPYNLGCYCTTVHRRLIMLAGCAVLTKRHILTTASSTDLILDKLLPQKPKQIQELLGFWYDITDDLWNSSFYSSPARIHHHPKYGRANTVNISHPIPCQNDLSVWTTLAKLHWNTCTCLRGASHRWQYLSTKPRWNDIAHVVGFQYMKAFKKVPMPWYKYVVRTKKYIVPCPKTEWGHFHCMPGSWAKFGLESGAAWHRALENRYWVYDGLIGMAAFSLHLRSEEITHYFTIIDRHHVLDFIYDAYVGMLPYAYLDSRYQDSKWSTPYLKPGHWVDTTIYMGDQYYASELPMY